MENLNNKMPYTFKDCGIVMCRRDGAWQGGYSTLTLNTRSFGSVGGSTWISGSATIPVSTGDIMEIGENKFQYVYYFPWKGHLYNMIIKY